MATQNIPPRRYLVRPQEPPKSKDQYPMMLTVGLVMVLGVLFLGGTQASSPGPGLLQASTNSDKNNVIDDSSVTIHEGTPLYVFMKPGSGIVRVDFKLIDNAGITIGSYRDSTEPFDLVSDGAVVRESTGLANAWKPSQGKYTVSAETTFRSGDTETFQMLVLVHSAYGTSGSSND